MTTRSLAVTLVLMATGMAAGLDGFDRMDPDTVRPRLPRPRKP